ncbi:tripartite tricarboxylate transporter substrate binding protein [Halalkalibacter krulwichiae]|uniref:Tripartite tricarboxylate transporter family receptor n=1 Tax=Halalkalibacter krulwichiae TaxID=199441 RepID=A0A1X9M8F1_9BACI|nr:tripartite tricarboxylate transporter substrate binding protein [Halalkalibacter krulwichiae]ARK28870.1 Tripartite tricarboxylate transporter family receptor [Halalkalibacter krulwichiae]
MKKYLLMISFSLFIMTAFVGCSNESTQTEGSDNDKGEGVATETEETSEIKLDGDVEFIVPASAGGGSDINVRMLAEVIRENNIIDENILVVNKPGGSTAIANSYTYNKEGSNNTVLSWVSSQLISPIINNNDVTIENLTPLATLTLDSYLFVVNGDSEYESLEEIVTAARENPATVTIGGTGQGTELHILSHLISKYADAEFKYVPFDSGGETISALLGGHIDAILSNPNEIASQVEAGGVRALATSSEDRLSGVFSEVPTFNELGFEEIQIASFRGYVGPPGMSEEEIAFWEDVLRQVHESDMWQQDYIERYQLNSEFLNAEESKQFYQEVLDLYLQASEEMGLID